MPTFTRRSPMPASADALYAWHARPAAFARLTPPWEDVRVVAREGGFGTDGYRVTLRAGVLGPVKGTWVAEHVGFVPGREFRDRQLRGPFAAWEHTHRMIPDGEGSSFLEDHIDYRLPLGGLGRLFGGGLVRRRLEAMFAYRHALTASDLRRHGLYADRPRLKVAVTGSRGLIGSELAAFLTTGGHAVTRLVSGGADPAADDGARAVPWDPREEVNPAALADHDAVVHLAAENIAEGRWTAAKKDRIRQSRTVPTRHLAETVAVLPPARRPKVFVSASAVGVYGDRGDEVLTEESEPGGGLLADVCREWEAAAEPAAAAGVRVVNVRFGVVLSPKGGALAKQLPAFRAGAGATLGSGRQWLSWVAVGDAVGAVHHTLMTDGLTGPVNVAAPNPVTNRAFTKTLGRVLGRPAVLWVPRPALRVLFGEVADAALLASQRAVPDALTASGFAFDHPELEGALRFVLGKPAA
ncbi:MAG: TIGR01777 family oxidoreductase [Gemmataceae bacterium]|nr:TIGR01777 family oxidoreductase [Gemmataceae bacterium]